jgi:hypothetical protein
VLQLDLGYANGIIAPYSKTAQISVNHRQIKNYEDPNPDHPEKIATKAPGHKAERVTFWLIFIFASLWRKCFATKFNPFTNKGDFKC